MSKVFVDSSAYFAFVNQNDARHAAAVTIFDRIRRDPSMEVYTTELVVAETHALITNRLKRHDLGVRFLRAMEQLDAGGTKEHLITMTRQTIHDAIDLLERRPDVLLSLTDAVSIVVMRQKHIAQMVSFDSDFTQFGIPLLQP